MVCHFASKVNSVIFQADNFDAPSSHLCCGQPFAVLMLFPLYSDHYFFVFCFWSSRNIIHTHTHHLAHQAKCIDSSLYHQRLLISLRKCLTNMLHGCELVMLLSAHTNHIIMLKCVWAFLFRLHSITISLLRSFFFSSSPNANAYLQPNRTHRYWTNR